jgi:hypothetical protein
MDYFFITILSVFLGVASTAQAEIGASVVTPGISIGINVPEYPQLVPIPGSPVYYDPVATSNYFFYDGLFWVYAADDWYVSTWYDGPWQLVIPEEVPIFILRIPVSYYLYPPAYFLGWRPDAPPHWGEYWGQGWERRRRGWDRWDHRSIPPRAPLPDYQRRYSGDRYPPEEQQRMIESKNYRFKPRETAGLPNVHQQEIPRGSAVGSHGQAFPQQRAPAPVRREELNSQPWPKQRQLQPQGSAMPLQMPRAGAAEEIGGRHKEQQGGQDHAVPGTRDAR